MTARDELGELLHQKITDRLPALPTKRVIGEYVDAAISEAIRAGYRKPRTITTAEELDALPDAVLILTEQGGYWESIKRMDRKNWWKEPGATSVVPSEDLTLPATVLHEGAQP